MTQETAYRLYCNAVTWFVRLKSMNALHPSLERKATRDDVASPIVYRLTRRTG
jgi:hypothetical protein